jgi:hypothetical protein
MVEVKVNASKIKGEEKNITTQLATFLKEKTGGEVSDDGGKITVKTDAVGVKKSYVKVMVKKFLHKKDLTDIYRVVAGEEETLVINERKGIEED